VLLNVCQLTESGERAVTGGTLQGEKEAGKNNNDYKLPLNEVTNSEMLIFRGMAFQICVAA